MDEPRNYAAGIPEDVQDLIIEGRKIEAIKVLREKTGLGLKEAKDQVDKVCAELQQKNPHLDLAKGKGCLIILAGIILAQAGLSLGTVAFCC